MKSALYSVKARLCLGLGLIILLLVAIGVQSVLSNRQTQEAMRSIVEVNVQAMIRLTTLRATVSDNRTIFALAGNGELTEAQRSEVEYNRQRANSAWESYYPDLITGDDQRQQAETFIEQLHTLRNLLDSGQVDESEMRQDFADLYDTITALYRSTRSVMLANYQQSMVDYQRGLMIVIGVMLAALLVAIAIGWWLARGILRPLQEATDFSTALAEGNLGVRLSNRYRDEFGRMLDAMAAMRDKLSGVIREVTQNARTVESISGELVASNENLSQRTQEQAASLQETASALEQITNTVSQNADNAGQADTLASEVSTQAKQG
uniref:methyl-accepting chemotaxis protein n=1 Tax=Salinicola endophyticus TaxID=1949083 RepID=UPI0013004E86